MTTRLVRDRYPLLTEFAAGRPLAELPVTVAIEKPSHHGQLEFTLHPGKVDAHAIEFFGFAKCHMLACAMHEATGWRFGVIHQLVHGTWKWSHAGVITPQGLFLDIHGIREKAEVVRRCQADYGPPACVVLYDSYADLLANVAPNLMQSPWTCGLDPLAVELTRVFADHLIAVAEAAHPTTGA